MPGSRTLYICYSLQVSKFEVEFLPRAVICRPPGAAFHSRLDINELMADCRIDATP